jgi:hypothetical protein
MPNPFLKNEISKVIYVEKTLVLKDCIDSCLEGLILFCITHILYESEIQINR